MNIHLKCCSFLLQILVEQRIEKVGLGYDGPINAELTKGDKKKQETWKKTQMRYQNLQSDESR